MASDHNHPAPGGDSAMLKFFIPGLVVGVVIGSMLGLYVGTRSGSAVVPDIKPSGGVRTEAPVHDEEPSAPAQETPAQDETKASETTPEQPKP